MSSADTDSRRYGALFRAGMSDTQRRVLDWVPRGARVLELGCAGGDMGLTLARDKGCRVLGVELDPDAAAEARERGLEVVEGSLEEPATLRALITRGPFDVVLATDVLEHLRDPEPVVAAFGELLGPRGLAVVAVPNVATWSMRWKLLSTGAWEYEETGLLDHTHLRFFTWDSIHRLVEAHGWAVVERVVDGYEIPGGNALFGRLPESLRKYVTGWPTLPEGWRRDLLRGANLKLDGVIRARQRLHRALLARVPNLVAPHIGLLLERRR